jgi:hypothetical protein
MQNIREVDPGYFNQAGNITYGGVGYAAQFKMGEVQKIVPEAYFTVGGIGKLVFIYNGLINADGSVRQSVSPEEFMSIGQGVGWYVPTTAPRIQQIVSMDKQLERINNRAKAGTLVGSDIVSFTRYLDKLTGRNISGGVSLARIESVEDSLARVEDGQWTSAMKRAAGREAQAAMTPTVRELKEADATLSRANARVQTRLGEVESSLTEQVGMLDRTIGLVESVAGKQAELAATVTDSLATVRSELDARSTAVEEAISSSQTRSRWFDYGLTVLILGIIAWLIKLTAGQSKLARARKNLELPRKTKTETEKKEPESGEMFDPKAHLKSKVNKTKSRTVPAMGVEGAKPVSGSEDDSVSEVRTRSRDESPEDRPITLMELRSV